MAARTLTVVTQQQQPARKLTAAEALHETADEFLECRDLRHPWTSVGCFYAGREIHRKIVCPRCGTEATDRWTGNGKRISRAYKYPPGYQAKGAAKRIRPIDVRREVLQRVVVYKTEEEMLGSLFVGRKRA